MEGRAKSRSGDEENRTVAKRIGRRESSGRDAKTCSGARNSKVSGEIKVTIFIIVGLSSCMGKIAT